HAAPSVAADHIRGNRYEAVLEDGNSAQPVGNGHDALRVSPDVAVRHGEEVRVGRITGIREKDAVLREAVDDETADVDAAIDIRDPRRRAPDHETVAVLEQDAAQKNFGSARIRIAGERGLARRVENQDRGRDLWQPGTQVNREPARFGHRSRNMENNAARDAIAI